MSNMVVRTNVLALNSHRNLGMVGTQQARASQRLSSGFRINSAADDAAGLGISEKMRSQIRGLDQASRNGQDGISLIQTAEGAMSTIAEMVTRIRELVVQASNDTNVHDDSTLESLAQSDRRRIQDEIDQLMAEIDATRNRVEFNTRTLLNGSLDDSQNAVAAAASTAGTAGTVSTASIAGTASVASTASTFGTAGQPSTGAGTNSISTAAPVPEPTAGTILPSTPGNPATTAGVPGVAATAEVHEVPEIASTGSTGSTASTQGTRAVLEKPDGSSLWFHVGANVGQGINLNISDISVDEMSARGTQAVNAAVAASGLGLTGADFTFGNLRSFDTADGKIGGVLRASGEEINLFLTGIDMALAHVTGERSNLGATQNRLEYTIENLDIASENLSAANSRIRDADMASEMMKLTQANVLQQAATAMLAQANQAPQAVLQLLG